MKFKHLFSLIMVFSTLTFFTCTASATSLPISQAVSFNEYDYIEFLQESSPQDLQDAGLSVQEADVIISVFDAAVLDRAMLPEDELRAMGYDEYEISLFHSYANGESLSSAELRSLSGVCTGSFIRSSVGTKTATFSYVWSWDHKPFVTLYDCAAFQWIAYDKDGGTIGTQIDSSSGTVDYYFDYSSSPIAYTQNATKQPGLNFNTLNYQFGVIGIYQYPNGNTQEVYAKSGKITVTISVPDDTNQDIHHVFLSGIYGHTLVGIGSPSVSIGPDGFSISFTGNTSVDSIGERKATIYRSSSSIEYWN